MKLVSGYRPSKRKKKKPLMRYLRGIFATFFFIFLLGVIVVQSQEGKDPGSKLQLIEHLEKGVEILQSTKLKEIAEEEGRQALENKLFNASFEFNEAQKLVASYDPIFLRYLPGTPFHALRNSIELLKNVTTFAKNNLILLDGCLKDPQPDCISFFDIEKLIETTSKLSSKIKHINSQVFPKDVRDKFSTVKEILSKGNEFYSWYKDNKNTLREAFGATNPKTYLVLFQNSAESRPTGGFVGSMMYLTFYQGELISNEYIDVHQLDFDSGAYIDAPDYLSPYIKRLSIHESNIFPETQSSGSYILGNMKKTSAPTVDGVIFISVGILHHIFSLIPEVELDGKIYTEDNFFELLEWEIEKHNLSEFPKEKNPKEALFTFIEAVLDTFYSCDCLDKAVELLPKILAKKQLQIYVTDPALQELLQNASLTSSFPNTEEQDFTALIFSSYFNKSNRFIEKEVRHLTREFENYYETEITLTLSHQFSSSYEGYIYELIPELSSLSTESQEYIFNIFGKGQYNFFLEIFLPQNASNIEIQGVASEKLQTLESFGTQHIAFNDILFPTKQKAYLIRYRVPKTDSYQFYWFNQADSLVKLEKIFIGKNEQVQTFFNGLVDRDLSLP